MFFIIDGSGIVNTQYYGQQNAQEGYRKSASDATLEFVNKLINDYHPDHLAVVLDESRETTFRKQIYADYKAQRSTTPAELKQEMLLTKEKLEQQGICCFRHPMYEADDFAGSIVNTFPYEDFVLISKDQDYLQLVSKHCFLWLYKTEAQIDALVAQHGDKYRIGKKMFCFTPELCKEHYGIQPLQIPDLKGLNGDTSDNIPGVKRLGAAALPLLQRYGTIEDMYLELAFVDEKTIKKAWKAQMNLGPSKYDLLMEQRESALLSKQLATICTTLPLPKNIDYYNTPNIKIGLPY